MITDLPPGWVWATLGDLGRHHNGRAFKSADWGEVGRPIIRIQNLTGSGSKYNHFDGQVDSRHVVSHGDLLVSWAATLGVYVWRGPEAVLNQHIFKVESHISPQFHRWLLESVVTDLYRQAHGSGMVHITKKKFEQTPVRLPPAAEQGRIVTAIEEHFSRLDAAVDASTAAATKATAMRRSILLEALSGRLSMRVADAEPASALLGRIATSRAQFKGGPPTAVEGASSSLHDLPSGWIWARLQDVAAAEPRAITDGPFGSNLKTAHYTESGPRVIRLQNIGDGEFKHEDAHISPGHYESLLAHSVKKDDLIVASLGESLPRACLVPDWVPPAIVKADCIRVRIHPEVNPAYINLALQHPQLRRETMVKIKGVGRPRLGMQGIKDLVIPLAPRAEQQLIVAAVEEHFSRADAVRDTVSASLAKVDAMRRIVLSEAFAGRLVPQDPDEEPATALLERISKLKPT